MLENQPLDAELIRATLDEGKLTYESKLVETLQDFESALDEYKPDIILSDYKLTGFDGLQALSLVRFRSFS